MLNQFEYHCLIFAHFILYIACFEGWYMLRPLGILHSYLFLLQENSAQGNLTFIVDLLECLSFKIHMNKLCLHMTVKGTES